MVRGFFGNGGRRAWIRLVVGEKAAPAARSLRQRGVAASVELLRLTAAYRGTPDAGPWVGPTQFPTSLGATR